MPVTGLVYLAKSFSSFLIDFLRSFVSWSVNAFFFNSSSPILSTFSITALPIVYESTDSDDLPFFSLSLDFWRSMPVLDLLFETSFLSTSVWNFLALRSASSLTEFYRFVNLLLSCDMRESRRSSSIGSMFWITYLRSSDIGDWGPKLCDALLGLIMSFREVFAPSRFGLLPETIEAEETPPDLWDPPLPPFAFLAAKSATLCASILHLLSVFSTSSTSLS